MVCLFRPRSTRPKPRILKYDFKIKIHKMQKYNNLENKRQNENKNNCKALIFTSPRTWPASHSGCHVSLASHPRRESISQRAHRLRLTVISAVSREQEEEESVRRSGAMGNSLRSFLLLLINGFPFCSWTTPAWTRRWRLTNDTNSS